MATITNGNAGSRRDYVLGNLRGVQVTSGITTGDIWQPGLRIIETMDVQNTTTQSTVTYSMDVTTTLGQATITVTNGAATNAVLMAWGY